MGVSVSRLLPALAQWVPLLPELLAPLRWNAAALERGERAEWEKVDKVAHDAGRAPHWGAYIAEEKRRLAEEPSLRASALNSLRHFELGERGEVFYAAVGMALDATGKPLPVLTVWGWRDSMCPAVPGLARVRALVPQTEVWLDPNAGHAMPLERPADVAERLVEFWSRV